MEATERLELPLIIPGQAQKEVVHNEALALLDAIVAGAVYGVAINDPPTAPVPGACYIVGPQPTGGWLGKADYVAAFSPAGWRFVAPVIGMSLIVQSTGLAAAYGATGWEVGKVRASQLIVGGTQVVGSQQAAIASPAGGATVDSEARAAVGQILLALRTHGLIAEV